MTPLQVFGISMLGFPCGLLLWRGFVLARRAIKNRDRLIDAFFWTMSYAIVWAWIYVAVRLIDSQK